MDGLQRERSGLTAGFASAVKAFAVGILLVAGGCGSGSGGNDDPLKQDEVFDEDADREIEVRGTVRQQSGEPIEDLTVCALGDCDTTDEDGSYSLAVSAVLFRGGDVLFTFEGDNFATQAVARDLPGGGQDAIVDFQVRNGQMVAVSVQSGGRDEEDGDVDGDGEVEIRGTVRTGGVGVEGLQVCALGECDDTDENGSYSFTIPDNVFPGGDVLFSFEGDNLTAQAVAQNLPGNNRDAIVNFAVTRDGISATDVRAGGTGDDEDVDDDVEDEDGGDVTVSGVVRGTETRLEDVTICALGDCDELDSDGSYQLEVPRNVFAGGDVLFTFEGDGLTTQTVAQDLPGNNRDASVNFVIVGNQVEATSVTAGAQTNDDDQIDEDEIEDDIDDFEDEVDEEIDDIEDEIDEIDRD